MKVTINIEFTDDEIKSSVATLVDTMSAVVDSAQKSPSKIDAEFEEKCSRQDDIGGWRCCKCFSFNGNPRATCRQCAHDRCDQTVTPASAEKGGQETSSP